MPPSEKSISDIVRAINASNSDIGMVMLIHYDGNIETLGVMRAGYGQANKNPPPENREIISMVSGLSYEVYSFNPNCILQTHGESYYTICR